MPVVMIAWLFCYNKWKPPRSGCAKHTCFVDEDRIGGLWRVRLSSLDSFLWNHHKTSPPCFQHPVTRLCQHCNRNPVITFCHHHFAKKDHQSLGQLVILLSNWGSLYHFDQSPPVQRRTNAMVCLCTVASGNVCPTILSPIKNLLRKELFFITI